MKITNTTPVPNTTHGPASSGKSGTVQAPRSHASTPELDSPAVKRALAASGEVDMNRVNQMRQAISEGQVSLDPDKLAEAILGMHLS